MLRGQGVTGLWKKHDVKNSRLRLPLRWIFLKFGLKVTCVFFTVLQLLCHSETQWHNREILCVSWYIWSLMHALLLWKYAETMTNTIQRNKQMNLETKYISEKWFHEKTISRIWFFISKNGYSHTDLKRNSLMS